MAGECAREMTPEELRDELLRRQNTNVTLVEVIVDERTARNAAERNVKLVERQLSECGHAAYGKRPTTGYYCEESRKVLELYAERNTKDKQVQVLRNGVTGEVRWIAAKLLEKKLSKVTRTLLVELQAALEVVVNDALTLSEEAQHIEAAASSEHYRRLAKAHRAENLRAAKEVCEDMKKEDASKVRGVRTYNKGSKGRKAGRKRRVRR